MSDLVMEETVDGLGNDFLLVDFHNFAKRDH
jgi:hypothetical protein